MIDYGSLLETWDMKVITAVDDLCAVTISVTTSQRYCTSFPSKHSMILQNPRSSQTSHANIDSCSKLGFFFGLYSSVTKLSISIFSSLLLILIFAFGLTNILTPCVIHDASFGSSNFRSYFNITCTIAILTSFAAKNRPGHACFP